MVDYDQHSSAQQQIVLEIEDRIRTIVGHMARAESEMRIVDDGCGPGTAFGPSGSRSAGDGVRNEAAIGSFYEQMVHDDTVDLGTCFAASHWLSGAVRLRSPGTVEVAATTEHPDDIIADLVADPVADAEAYTGYIRAFADSSLRTQLFEPSAADDRHDQALADEFDDRLHELYRTRLDEFAFEQ